MKTVSQIESEMQTLVANRGIYKPRELSSAKKRMQFLTICKMYLEDNPNPEFLIKEKGRIEARIRLLGLNYDYWKSTQLGAKNSFDDYKKEMGIVDLEVQLKTLKYLLNE